MTVITQMPRIDGSANQELAGDGSAALTRRVQFANEKFRAKAVQPDLVTEGLCGGLMAKLMVCSDEEGRTETWEVGRLKSAKKVNINLPQGGTTVVAVIFV